MWTQTPKALFLLSAFALVSAWSCGGGREVAMRPEVVSPETRAQALLINLAILNPRLAEPLVKGFSAAALDRAVGLVVATGVEESRWAEGLLQRTWWLPGDLEGALHEPGRVEEVLSEVRKAGSTGGQDDERRQREARDLLAGRAGEGAGGSFKSPAGESSATKAPVPMTPGGANPREDSSQRRAELEDAVRWVQYTQAWSSYYEAASRDGDLVGAGSENALDQAVTMSLVRPDFLDRLAALMAEGLGI